MISKKIFMGLSKFAIVAIIASSLSMTVYAKDGDVWKENSNLGGIGDILLHNHTIIFDLIKNTSTYEYEVSNELYSVDQVNKIFIENPTKTTKTIQESVLLILESTAPVPIDTTGLVVSTVSVINVTTVTEGTVPELPTTINVTLSDGTTKAVEITWNAVATEAATYATAGIVTVNGTLADYNNYEISASVTVSKVQVPVISAAINLGEAGNYAILAKTGVSTVPQSVITGDIGVSPNSATALTGFDLVMDATNVFSTSTQVTGELYASDYALATPSNLTTAISNMQTAYTDAAGRTVDFTELYTGDISGRTLTAGVYKWGTGVLINSDVTLNGGTNDVFIFQIDKGITQGSDTNIILTGGVQAKNIFWQSAETVSIGTCAHFEGIVMSMTDITLGTNASINGRLLAQTAVTLDKSTVLAPK
ncbi:MAG: hypothetical protein ACI8WT_000738 [Clostridium sp.]|jgi:hypothetical protein